MYILDRKHHFNFHKSRYIRAVVKKGGNSARCRVTYMSWLGERSRHTFRPSSSFLILGREMNLLGRFALFARHAGTSTFGNEARAAYPRESARHVPTMTADQNILTVAAHTRLHLSSVYVSLCHIFISIFSNSYIFVKFI
jgi:hypothetical protein